jgi:hypothetical protein
MSMSISRVTFNTIFAGAALFMLAAQGHAQFAIQDQKPKSDEPTPIKLVLHPADPPYAALRYRLLPRLPDQVPGDAAAHYLRMCVILAGHDGDKLQAENVPDLLTVPIAKFPKEEARALLNHGVLEVAHLAARRSRCDWEYPLREIGIRTLLPDLAQLRKLSTMLAIKARLEIAEGKLDDATDTIMTGLSLSRQIGQGPTLIGDLVAASTSAQMLDRVRELIQLPNCPNLYWTLTELPTPFVDIRIGLQWERGWFQFTVPQLSKVRGAKLSTEQWNALLAEVIQNLRPLMEQGGLGSWESDLKTVAILTVAYPNSKEQLRDAGYSQKDVDAMSPAQAILTGFVETSDRMQDELYKWTALPLPVALPGIKSAEQKLNDVKASSGQIASLVKMLIPAVSRARVSLARVDREIAALRCLEAIRLYAARHEGRLPPALSDIAQVQVPVDPITEKPFFYEVAGGLATLAAPPIPGFDDNSSDKLQWEIELATSKK